MYRLMILVVISIVSSGCGLSVGNNNIVDDLIEVEEQLKIEQEQEEVFDKSHGEDNIIGEVVDITPIENLKDYSALDEIEVDVDVSILPTSLAFAQVSRMMFDLVTYEGNTVKIKGMYYHDQIPELDIDRKTIMLLDELSCCQGYFEIILPDGVEYPENGSQMMLVGEYVLNTNGEYSYPMLKVTDYIF